LLLDFELASFLLSLLSLFFLYPRPSLGTTQASSALARLRRSWPPGEVKKLVSEVDCLKAELANKQVELDSERQGRQVTEEALHS
jgi:hypothetical protein